MEIYLLTSYRTFRKSISKSKLKKIKFDAPMKLFNPQTILLSFTGAVQFWKDEFICSTHRCAMKVQVKANNEVEYSKLNVPLHALINFQMNEKYAVELSNNESKVHLLKGDEVVSVAIFNEFKCSVRNTVVPLISRGARLVKNKLYFINKDFDLVVHTFEDEDFLGNPFTKQAQKLASNIRDFDISNKGRIWAISAKGETFNVEHPQESYQMFPLNAEFVAKKTIFTCIKAFKRWLIVAGDSKERTVYSLQPIGSSRKSRLIELETETPASNAPQPQREAASTVVQKILGFEKGKLEFAIGMRFYSGWDLFYIRNHALVQIFTKFEFKFKNFFDCFILKRGQKVSLVMFCDNGLFTSRLIL